MTRQILPSQEKLMQEAAEAGRQPICRYCKHPLDKIIQCQSEIITWIWNNSTKRYDKYDNDGDADRPEHQCKICNELKTTCDAADWEFVDDDLVSY